MQDHSLLALSGVYHMNERLFSRLLRQHGMENLSPAQSRILMALWEQDDIPVRQLAGLTSLDKSTLSLSLSRMEQFGIVLRSGDTQDHRVVRVKLTARGQSCLDACNAAWKELTDYLYHGIDAEDLNIFSRVLDQIYEKLSDRERLREV